MKSYNCDLSDVIFSLCETPAGSCELAELTKCVASAKKLSFNCISPHSFHFQIFCLHSSGAGVLQSIGKGQFTIRGLGRKLR